MAIGRRWGTGALGPIVLLVTTTAGCRWIPARRAETAPATPSLEVADASLPSLPAMRPIGDEEAFLPSAATPLLDAAATRDAAVKRAIAMELESPDPPARQSAPSPKPNPTPKTEIVEASDNPKDDPDVSPVTYTPPTRPVDAAPDAQPPQTEVRETPRDLPEDPPAATPVESASPRDRAEAAALWSTVMEALASPVPSDEKNAEAVDDPAPLAPAPPHPAATSLSISDMRLCRKVLGFGRTEALSSDSCKPGQTILLYCEIDGLRDEEGPDGFRSLLGSTVAILPASGGDPVWLEDLGVVEDHCRRRRRDFFVNYRINLPTNLLAGEYRIQVVQKDILAGREASRTLPLSIRP